MQKVDLISKGKYLRAQSGPVLVKSFMFLRENPKKVLLLKLENARNDTLDGLCLSVAQLDAKGKRISSRRVEVCDLHVAGNKTFVLGEKIEVAETCYDFVVTIVYADYGKYRLSPEKSGVGIDYVAEKQDIPFDPVSVQKKLGGGTLAVRERKFKAPFFVCLFSVLLLVCLFGFTYLQLNDFKEKEISFLDEGIEYTFEGGDKSDRSNIYVTGYHGTRSRLEIPAKIEGHTVTKIEKNAFAGNSVLYQVALGGSVRIEAGAFTNCSNLQTINFEKVTYIGEYAFEHCTNLYEISASNIKEIGDYAFSGCQSLQNVNLTNQADALRIGSFAFAECCSLSRVEIAQFIRYPEDTAIFLNCRNIERLYLKNYNYHSGEFSSASDQPLAALFGVKGECAPSLRELRIEYTERVPSSFCENASLEKATFDHIMAGEIDERAFYNCRNLREINVPDTLTSVGDQAFSLCAVGSFDGKSLQRIGNSAFENCEFLETFRLQGNTSLQTIGSNAFRGCTSLRSIDIPARLTQISERVFENCASLLNVGFSLKSELSEIFEGAFANCTMLSKIDLPNGVRAIGLGAFQNCASLSAVRLPSELNFVGDYAFENCPLTSLSFPKNVEEIGTSAFQNCGLLSSVSMPERLRLLGDYSFANCTNLTEVSLFGEIERMGFASFVGCESLVSMRLPFVGETPDRDAPFSYLFGSYSIEQPTVPRSLKNVTVTDAERIPENAFYGCSDVSAIYLPDKLVGIGSQAFAYCTSLRDVALPDSLEHIESNAFLNCSSLAFLKIPDTVNYMGWGILSNCSSLAELTLPFVGETEYQNTYLGYLFGCGNPYDGELVPKNLSTVRITGGEKLSDNAFSSCTGIRSVVLPQTMISIGREAFYNCLSLSEIALPPSLIDIGERAFAECGSLSSLSVPNSTQTIGMAAFQNCWNLTKLTVPFAGYSRYENAYFSYIFGAYSPADSWSVPSSLDTVTITDCYIIYPEAFYNCNSLRKIVLPDNVNYIGTEAFSQCASLTEINLPGSVTVLEDNVFSYCSSLREILLSENLTTIGQYAFKGCVSLEKISLPDALRSLGDYAFSECNSLAALVLPDEIGYIGNGCVQSCENLQELTVPYLGADSRSNSDIGYFYGTSTSYGYIPYLLKSVTVTKADTIGDYAFYNCGNIKEIVLPASLRQIGGYAFYDCYGLKSIDLPSSLIRIGNYAFNNCNLFESIDLPSSLAFIGNYAFNFCSGLKTIDLPASLYELGNAAFAYCSSLTQVNLPASLSKIPDNAFQNCQRLEKIELPQNLREIGAYAFGGCNSLHEFLIPDSVEKIGRGCIADCSGIGELTLPFIGETMNSADSLGYVYDSSYFYNTLPSGLKSVKVTKAEALGGSCFYGGGSIEEIQLPDTLLSIGDHAFNGCGALTALTLPDSLQTIGYGILTGCNRLERLTLPFIGSTETDGTHLGGFFGSGTYYGSVPSSLKTVTVTKADALFENAFYACGDIEEIILPAALTKIGSCAFYNCYRLKTLDLPDTLTEIGEHAFYNCDAFELLLLPEKLSSIGNYAFADCGSITELTLPDSVESVGRGILENCEQLTRLTAPFIGETRTTNTYLAHLFGYGSYYGSIPANLKDVTVTNAEAIGENAFNNCEGLEKVDLPTTLKTIGPYAFNGCKHLNSIVLPADLQSIGNYAFNGCYRLFEVWNNSSLDVKNDLYNTGNVAMYALKVYDFGEEEIPKAHINGFYFAKGDIGWALVGYPEGEADLRLPETFVWDGETVDSYVIPAHLFRENYLIQSLFIPAAVSAIGYECFVNCGLLQKVAFAENSPLSEIPPNAFSSCLSLTEIEIPAVERIGSSAFYSCTSLKSFVLPETLAYIDWYAFENCYNLREIYNYSALEIICGDSSFGSIARYAMAVYRFPDDERLEYVMIGDVRFAHYRDTWVAVGCDDTVSQIELSEFTYQGERVTSFEIGRHAFEAKGNLQKVVIGKAVDLIGEYAFYNCWNLGEVIFENSDLKVIARNAFSSCSNLTKIVLPQTLTEISDSAFQYCSALASVDLPDSLVSIGPSAFWGCSSLTEIAFPESLRTIFNYAFYNCRSLPELILPEGLQTIEYYAFEYCSQIRVLVIPSTVTDIGGGAFDGCTHLYEVYNLSELPIEAGSTDYGYAAYYAAFVYHSMEENGVLYEFDQFIFIRKEQWYLFKNMDGNSELRLPESFVYEGEKIVSYAICDHAMEQHWMQSVMIPRSVTEIGRNAFYNANSLSVVYYGGTAKEWNALVDQNTAVLHSCTVYYYADCVHEYGQWTYDGDKNIVTSVAECDWRVAKLPTCTEKGLQECVCSVCGNVLESREIETAEHVVDENGVCSVCNQKGYALTPAMSSFLGIAFAYDTNLFTHMDDGSFVAASGGENSVLTLDSETRWQLHFGCRASENGEWVITNSAMELARVSGTVPQYFDIRLNPGESIYFRYFGDGEGTILTIYAFSR